MIIYNKDAASLTDVKKCETKIVSQHCPLTRVNQSDFQTLVASPAPEARLVTHSPEHQPHLSHLPSLEL